MRLLSALLLILMASSVSWARDDHPAATTSTLQVVIIGDSTVANYPARSEKRGWGQMIPSLFDAEVAVLSLASSGRSTKTFIQSGLWGKALDACRPGDYVLIQFGHNDSHDKEKPESTDARTDYKEFLRQYIDQARAREVIPVLVTPMHRRAFGPDGRIGQRLTPYAVAMREVAAEKKTPCVDLYEASGLVMQKLGPDGCLPLFCNPKDFAHFSGKGATLMADLVAREMKRLDIGLSAHVILPAIPDENKP